VGNSFFSLRRLLCCSEAFFPESVTAETHVPHYFIILLITQHPLCPRSLTSQCKC
jgi:hypothetical protein